MPGAVLSEVKPVLSVRRHIQGAAAPTPALPADLHRQRLLADWPEADRPWATRLAELLRVQDGSATRLCEHVAGGAVGLVVHHQQTVPAEQAPPEVRVHLPGAHYIERLVTLHAHGQVMMDNHSWLAPAALPPDIQAELAAGRTPIGHLLARMWIRRVACPEAQALWPLLWQHVGLPDDAATRSYLIRVPQGADPAADLTAQTVDLACVNPLEGSAAMLITECFRRGMLMPPAAPQY